jgi:hypothetical protein
MSDLRGEKRAWRGPLIRGIRLFDLPTLARVRLTICRRHGHLTARGVDYCLNCGTPWLLRRRLPASDRSVRGEGSDDAR